MLRLLVHVRLLLLKHPSQIVIGVFNVKLLCEVLDRFKFNIARTRQDLSPSRFFEAFPCALEIPPQPTIATLCFSLIISPSQPGRNIRSAFPILTDFNLYWILTPVPLFHLTESPRVKSPDS